MKSSAHVDIDASLGAKLPADAADTEMSFCQLIYVRIEQDRGLPGRAFHEHSVLSPIRTAVA
jgi:hypothetical protein